MRIISAAAHGDLSSFLHAGYCSASPGYKGMDRKEILDDTALWEEIRSISFELSEAVAQRNREHTAKLREKHNKKKDAVESTP